MLHLLLWVWCLISMIFVIYIALITYESDKGVYDFNGKRLIPLIKGEYERTLLKRTIGYIILWPLLPIGIIWWLLY